MKATASAAQKCDMMFKQQQLAVAPLPASTPWRGSFPSPTQPSRDRQIYYRKTVHVYYETVRERFYGVFATEKKLQQKDRKKHPRLGPSDRFTTET